MSKDRKQLPTSNPFKEAVEATPEIKNCYQPGLQALGSYSTKIELLNNRECNGSVEIDECVRPNYPTANRWDYVVSYKSAAYFIEVHSAETSEVSVVLTKLQWLKDWLNEQAPELAKLKAKQPYYWIQSGKFSIPKTTPQYRRAVQSGILPISKLILK